MGIKSIVRSVFGGKKAGALADAVVAELKRVQFTEGTLADAIADSIAAASDSGKSNREKFETVVKEFAPVVERYVRSGGVPAAVSDLTDAAKDLTRQLVQSVFNETTVKSGVQLLIEALAKRFKL